jgi:nucleoside-diphosphate-sugar epimerase
MDADPNSSVLVTGARGFIGRAVVKLLQREGYRVVALDASAVESGSDCESVREIECDIGNASELRRTFEMGPIDGIVHLAAILPTAAQRDPGIALRVNVEGGAHVLGMASMFGVRRVVFGSSLSIYGTYAADRVVSEIDRASPEDSYGAAKLYVELLGRSDRGRPGMEFVSLRIGRVVGPGARSTTSAWRSEIFEFLKANHPVEIAMPYVGAERILLVHVDDAAKMLVTLLRAPNLKHSLYNAACESTTVAELKREVEALNPNITVKVGEEYANGNPRQVDFSRFTREFSFATTPMREQLRRAAGS